MGIEETDKSLTGSAAFEEHESEVRSYCRKYPTVFTKAKGSILYDENGREYIDFLCGAGSCNFGHNNSYIKEKVIDYLESDGILHGLDMYSKAKSEFIETLEHKILIPRGFNYKIMFPGPAGTIAVEAALKIVRKVTGRSNVMALTGGFHGMTLGALEVTTERLARSACGVKLNNSVHVPHPCSMPGFDTIAYIEDLIENDHSGVDKPAAIIVESVQGEGGINILPVQWLKDIRELCDRHGILLILDEIQCGCARCGSFFSFERSGIKPDVIVMAKSIGGMGLPSALVLVKPEYDVLVSGEHNGTFRGFQLAFVAGKAAIEYMLDNNIEAEARRKGDIIIDYLKKNMPLIDSAISVRGLGCMCGIDLGRIKPGTAQTVRKKCFEKGLILELSGREDTVVKIMPALNIEDDLLMKGLEIIKKSIIEAVSENNN
ncbi:MAG TPA: aspartate aminotransferase family protein [Methanocorpusculum sp.]|nr:aspartate aminotransferase family protein [Methanocorpusculum sp.]